MDATSELGANPNQSEEEAILAREKNSPKASTRNPTKATGSVSRPLAVAVDFLSYDNARELVVKNGVTNKSRYAALKAKHHDLPKEPDVFYGSEWQGWFHFFNLVRPYETMQECRAAILALGIGGIKEYKKRRFEDPRLPANPANTYENFPDSFAYFIGREQIPYETYQEASAAAIRLGFKSRDSYLRGRHKDPKLPMSPSRIYGRSWAGWIDYLQIDLKQCVTPGEKGFYDTYEEFLAAVQRMGFTSYKEYFAGYSTDPKLPSRPEDVYVAEWSGWSRAIPTRKSYLCETWQQAKAVALLYQFVGSSDYTKRHKIDKRLPANPARRYADFPGYDVFLLPDKIENLEDFKLCAKILKFKDEEGYYEARLKHPSLPDSPQVQFSDEWMDWYDACGLPKPYSYDELKEIVRLHECKHMNDYTKLWQKLRDPRMPANPYVGCSEWVNTYDFLGVDLPARLDFVTKKYAAWGDDIRSYLDTLEIKGRREISLCRFVRDYIEPNNLGLSVREFLSAGGADVKKFRLFLESIKSTYHGQRNLIDINEYLESALKRFFTEQDEEGYLYRVPGIFNPFAGVEFEGYKVAPSESVKPVLAYYCVEELRNWIVPEGAKSFSDLVDVQVFDGDYYPVDESIIDPSDSNCVYRKSGDQYFIWYPPHWIAMFALVSVPARGRQIMYNDSGEADEYIAELRDGNLEWVKNTSSLAQLGRQQGFLTCSVEGDWGMYFTTNKTSYDGAGYAVAWIPDKLAYWLTVLRDWQRKYNPINRLTPWVECAKRCNFAKKKLKSKVDATFLFRGWGESQPPIFASPMTKRLAAGLYHTQTGGVELATRDDKSRPSALKAYRSRFTPHSMRVSLITAYVVNAGVPISIIMKVAGHSSIVMSIYYTKIGTAEMRFQMAEAEKRALLSRSHDLQLMIEQQRIDALHAQLVANSEDALSSILAGHSGTQLVRDYGICPYAGARCGDGGEKLASNTYAPAPAGYLGSQNCPRCRHFVSGPVFLGGLASLWNEVSLNVNLLWEKYSDLDAQLERNRLRIQEEDYHEVECERSGQDFDCRERLQYEASNRRLHSDLEGVATKIDMLLCDMHAINKLIEDSRMLLKQGAAGDEENGVANTGVRLIATSSSDLQIEYHETSFFEQLNEVCVNATIYQSANAVMATPRRSQMIDRMAMVNGVKPKMFALSEKEQLLLGNQITEFFFKRLKSWDLLNQLVTGNLRLEDLSGPERVTSIEFEQLLNAPVADGDHHLESSAHSLEIDEAECVFG